MADGPFAVHTRHGNSSRSRDDRHGDEQHCHKVSAYNGARTAGDTPRNENEGKTQIPLLFIYLCIYLFSLFAEPFKDFRGSCDFGIFKGKENPEQMYV